MKANSYLTLLASPSLTFLAAPSIFPMGNAKPANTGISFLLLVDAFPTSIRPAIAVTLTIVMDLVQSAAMDYSGVTLIASEIKLLAA